MRVMFVVVASLLCHGVVSGQQFFNAEPAGTDSYGYYGYNAEPAGRVFVPPVDPSQMQWVRKAQWGAGHTIVVPAYQWSQYGSGDSLIVPNDQMYRYPLIPRPRPYTLTVPLLAR